MKKTSTLMIIYLLLIGSCLYASSPLYADNLPDRKTLVWAKNIAPPFYQERSVIGHKTFGDHLQRFLQAELPQYKHEVKRLRLSQLDEWWRQGIPFCFSTMIHSPNPAPHYLLSRPNVMYEPHGLIVRDKTRGELLNKVDDLVSLKDVVADTQLKYGYMSGRTFGPIIDGILSQLSDNTKTRELHQGETVSLFKKLSAGEFDYIVEYEYVFDYFKKHTFHANNLKFIPLREVEDSVVLGAVGCTNSPWGRLVIADINQAVQSLVADQDYQDMMVQWLASERGKASYLTKYKRHILGQEFGLERYRNKRGSASNVEGGGH